MMMMIIYLKLINLNEISAEVILLLVTPN